MQVPGMAAPGIEGAVAFKQQAQAFSQGIAVMAKQIEMARDANAQFQELLASNSALSPEHLGSNLDIVA